MPALFFRSSPASVRRRFAATARTKTSSPSSASLSCVALLAFSVALALLVPSVAATPDVDAVSDSDLKNWLSRGKIDVLKKEPDAPHGIEHISQEPATSSSGNSGVGGGGGAAHLDRFDKLSLLGMTYLSCSSLALVTSLLCFLSKANRDRVAMNFSRMILKHTAGGGGGGGGGGARTPSIGSGKRD